MESMGDATNHSNNNYNCAAPAHQQLPLNDLANLFLGLDLEYHGINYIPDNINFSSNNRVHILSQEEWPDNTKNINNMDNMDNMNSLRKNSPSHLFWFASISQSVFPVY